MANEQKEQKILSPDLAPAKQVLLAQTVMTPGWKVVVEIANEACSRFTQDIIKVDPESPDAEHVVSERQRRARIAIEFSDLLMKSVYAHADAVRKAGVKEEVESVSAVAAMYGIHPAAAADKGKDPNNNAITRTFGIHPARPKVKSPAKGKQ